MTDRKPRKRNPFAADLADEKYRQRIRPAKIRKWRKPKHARRDYEYEDDEPEAE